MLKWIKRLSLLLFALATMAFLAAWWLLAGSLPRLEGELTLAGLSAPVSVQRDALGVVTIDAANETDMARALGYVHAQERYFEMDLMRRTSAGELAELFGPIAIDRDKQHRVHRMRARVMENLDAFTGDKAAQLQAYTDGVNAGLEALPVRPWPYLLLRQKPRRWELVDSALAGYAMYFDLQDSQNTRELALWKIRSKVPPALYELLTHDGTEWDAPLFGEARGNATLPGADQVDLSTLPTPASKDLMRLSDKGTPGSNQWAVSGAHTADGRAIVADDMHLGLRAPNIWFRARLRYADAKSPGGKTDVSGFTLPGLPLVIVGSNGHIAWGFTNGYLDTADWEWIRETDINDRQPTEFTEQIRVAGSNTVALKIKQTDWGPLIAKDSEGNSLALRWVAHLPGALTFNLSQLSNAADMREAIRIADQVGMPAQNFIVADSTGSIGWRVTGASPARRGSCDSNRVANAPQQPAERAALEKSRQATGIRMEPCYRWGLQTTHPSLMDPPDGRLWTANNRTLDGADLLQAGDAGYALGARAKQIREDLFSREQFNEEQLLAIQLDNRAVFLQRWWALLEREGGNSQTPALQSLAKAARHWEGQASVDSVSYRVVRAWRLAVHARIADGLTAPAQAAVGDDFVMPDLPQLEGVVWPLLTERPLHLLSRRFPTWQALLEDAAVEVRDDLAQRGPVQERTWGERNTAKICHPLANALPALLKSTLCMRADPLPGDGAMPRVQGPAFGASERMVVSPGHEGDGIIHMPGGQSGNPLSPFWGAGHDDWAQGKPTPFLPGKTRYTLTLKP